MYIAPSWEERDYHPSYIYALVDEKISTDRRKEMIDLKLKATVEFNRISESRELLAEFLIAKDPTINISKGASQEFLFNQVYDILDKDPKYFLSVISDPYWNDKIFIYKAVKAGALVKTSKDRYATIGGEEIGKMGDVIHYINDPERIEFRKRIEHQIKEHNIQL